MIICVGPYLFLIFVMWWWIWFFWILGTIWLDELCTLNGEDRGSLSAKVNPHWTNHCESEKLFVKILNRYKFTLLCCKYQTFTTGAGYCSLFLIAAMYQELVLSRRRVHCDAVGHLHVQIWLLFPETHMLLGVMRRTMCGSHYSQLCTCVRHLSCCLLLQCAKSGFYRDGGRTATP